MSASSLRRAAAALLLLAWTEVSVAQTPPAPGPPPAAPPQTAPAPPGSQAGPPGAAPAAEPVAPAPDDPTRTPGGALSRFMSSRDYRTIRDLKSVMTASLRAIYDHDSTAFNGKKGIRLAAFDYREPMPKPGATSLSLPVKSLWEDQGEAIEQRTETLRLVRDESGLWRVAAMDKTATEPLRYQEAIPGVTALRMILRAWQRHDLESARSFMSDAYQQRFAGRDEGIAAVFTGDPAVKRAAFRIVELLPKGTTEATAHVRLVETTAGRPSSLEGTPRTIALVKKGPRWLLNDWK